MKRKTQQTSAPHVSAPAPSGVDRMRWALPIILLLYLLFGTAHIFSAPIGSTGYQDAPDEAAHVSYVKTLRAGKMPSRQMPHAPAAAGYPDYEWHQPPLYYALAVPFLAAGERSVRFLSLLCGLGSILLIYRTAKLIYRDCRLAGTLAAGIAAFIPAHIAILSAVNNDALLELCFSAAIYLMAKSFRNTPTAKDSLLLGLTLGAAFLTKTTSLLLVPVFIAALIFASRSGTQRGTLLKHAGIVLGTAIVISGWWFVRNVALYGELLPLRAFQQSFGGTVQAADVINGKIGIPVDGWSGYWTLVSQWCFQSFWAVYGTRRTAAFGGPMFLPASIYLLMLALCIAAVAGLARLHFRKSEFSRPQLSGIYLQFITLGLVIAAYVLFVSKYFQTQGRYLYPAMSGICMCLEMGWLALFPAKYKKLAAVGLLTVFALISAVFLIQTSNR